jgi:outer membrane immunogenic protein
MRYTASLALAFATLVGAAGATSAADLRRRPPPPAPAPYVAPYYNWTGFYIGISGGGAWGNSNWINTGDFDLSGGLVGGTIGYNWQTGPWVFGIEGDLSWTNIKGHSFVGCAPGCETENSWLGTVRGRIGYAFDRVLPYATGGLAFGNIKANIGGFTGADETNAGWTIGGGVEFALPANWTAKVEYLYVDLGDFSCGGVCGVFGAANPSFTTSIVRAGLNYRF